MAVIRHEICQTIYTTGFWGQKILHTKNLHSWKNFYATGGRDGRDRFQVWLLFYILFDAYDYMYHSSSSDIIILLLEKRMNESKGKLAFQSVKWKSDPKKPPSLSQLSHMFHVSLFFVHSCEKISPILCQHSTFKG